MAKKKEDVIIAKEVEETKAPESVTIGGKVYTRRRARVIDLSRAMTLPKGKEEFAISAQLACKTAIDGKPAVMEDIAYMWEDELDQLLVLFPEFGEATKNAISPK